MRQFCTFGSVRGAASNGRSYRDSPSLVKNEGLWLNDKNAMIGKLNINPQLQKKAKVKPLKLPKTKLGVQALGSTLIVASVNAGFLGSNK